MRLRTALCATASVVVLGFAVPVPAFAFDGDFTYEFNDTQYDTDGEAGITQLNPGVCLELSRVDPGDSAFRPHNFTTLTATIFSKIGCTGDQIKLKPGAHRGEEVRFSSVMFN